MITVDRIVVVEGKYDRIKLAGILDATVICTDGFGIFKNEELKKTLRALAEKRGLLILTDSDSAGFQIRSFIRSIVKQGEVLNAVTPDILGKERRKAQPSKQGKIGVEGIPDELIEQALINAGAVPEESTADRGEPITRADLMDCGLIGGENCTQRRQRLQRYLGLPELLSAKLLLEVVNKMYTRSGFLEAVRKLDGE